jgi:PAN domain
MIQGHHVVRIESPIVLGDDVTFQKLAEKFDKAIIFLSGQGGSLAATVAIGKTIREHDFVSAVATNTDCASLCGIAWLGGVKRIIFVGGRVDFHGPFELPKRNEEKQKSVNQLGTYLKELNLPYGVIAYLTCAPERRVNWIDDAIYKFRVGLTGKCPLTTNWLNPSIANLVGSIDVFFLNVESESKWMSYRKISLATLQRLPEAPELKLSNFAFVQKDGLDIIGLDLNGKERHSVLSEPLYVDNDKACEYQCRIEKGCTAYVYDSIGKQCSLVSKIQAVVKFNEMKIGYVENADWNFEQSSFESGGEESSLEGKFLSSLEKITIGDCLLHCEKNSKCSGFNASGDGCTMLTGPTEFIAIKRIKAGISMRRISN